MITAKNVTPFKSRVLAPTSAVVIVSLLLLAGAAFWTSPSSAGEATGAERWYFAEGCTHGGFQQYLCVGNRSEGACSLDLSYLYGDGSERGVSREVPPLSRMTIDVNREAGPGRDVSIIASAEEGRLSLERVMYFDYKQEHRGGHAVTGARSPGFEWYFAEGCTGPGFEEYILILNPGEDAATLTFRFQTEELGEVVVDNLSAAARSRSTFVAGELLGRGYNASLKLESDRPVVAERSMYFDYTGAGDRHWDGGHSVVGVTDLSRSYCFAEGTTRSGFDEWLTLQNPGSLGLSVDAEYQLGESPECAVRRTYSIAAGRRKTVYVPDEVGMEKDVSVRLTSTSEFLAERPVYFEYARGDLVCDGGHCITGIPSAGSEWFFAEGYTGEGFDEWLCVQNCGEETSTVSIDYFDRQGSSFEGERLEIGPGSRSTVDVNRDLGFEGSVSVRLRVSGGPAVVAERPMYFRLGDCDGGHAVTPAAPDGEEEPAHDPEPEQHDGLFGLCFGPWLRGNPCTDEIEAEEIRSLLDTISPHADWVRIFCAGAEQTLREAKERGLKVACGCDLCADREYSDWEVGELILRAEQGLVDLAVVGDEVLMGGSLSEERLVECVRRVKREVDVPVAVSEAYSDLLEHPGVVSECDVVLVNIHPYWQGVPVEWAVEYLAEAYRSTCEIAEGKKVLIGGTGWPSAGEKLLGAVPSPENSCRFLADFTDWADARGIEYFYFEAFDEPWRADREGEVGAHWGIWDAGASLKPGMSEALRR